MKRPVFFVPGWTDEVCSCWVAAYRRGYAPIKDWMSRVVPNRELATYVSFTKEESKGCRSFLDFAEVLKQRVWEQIGRKKPFDLVGHSMGGLDSVAAISDEEDPLVNVQNLVTVATPHQGSELGEIGPWLRKYEPQHAVQCVNLDPDELPIQMINKVESRKRLLERVGKLYCLMGGRDQAVMGSARYNREGLPAAIYVEKVETIEVDGATHSQKYGITQDPRVVLNVLRILLDIELKQPKKNYGFIFRRG